MPQPNHIHNLTPNEAITDALYRALRGLDLNDHALWLSGWSRDHSRCVFEMNGNASQGMDAIDKNIFQGVGPLTTTHFIMNPRPCLNEDGKTASLGAYALAQHYRPGDGGKGDAERLLSGSIYDLELEKDGDGMWRVVSFRMNLVWHEGNMAVVMGG
jgi:hypothetical protein